MVRSVRRMEVGILQGKDGVLALDGGDLSSGGGVMLVEQVKRRLHEVGSWSRLQRVLIKAEVLQQGDNPRFVVTNLCSDPKRLYDLCALRGE